MAIGAKTVPTSDNTRPTVLPRNSEPTIDRDVSANNDTINDKYAHFVSWCNGENELNTEFDIFLKQVDYFEKQNLSFAEVKGVKGRLAKNIEFWEKIGANSFVLETIKNGYVIPFIESPNSMHKANNKSAIHNSDFVTSAIDDLISSGCAVQVPFKPFIVNPLSVSIQKSGKKRLILDLSILNLSVKKEKIKFEDWKIAIQYFEQNTNMFKFDLKSGYFHLDICPQQQTYLGFCWKEKFYCFTVLPFGISTGPYIFTKCLRPLVKFWRENSVKIVLYLDDGFGMNLDEKQCIEDSKFVKQSLLDAGFLLNEEKSIFKPAKCLEWLGIIWNAVDFTLSIPKRRVDDLLSSLNYTFEIFPRLTARSLAQITGRIISMSPVIGNVSRIMTRYCYLTIESRSGWDDLLDLRYENRVKSELKFWFANINAINCKKLGTYSKSSVLVYSDASDFAAGAYAVELDEKVFHKMWTVHEMLESSTWRELKAIELALSSFKNVFAGKILHWHTDNQNCVKIVESGSMKEKLQNIALSIFSICLKKGISINIEWIPRKENVKADYISRIVDYEDWGVSVAFFQFMNELWGPYTVDRFASSENTKLGRFNSLFWNVNAEAVDAFSQNWEGENNWLVPPINSVIRTLKHLVACRGKGTLIVPKWKSAAYWPLIFCKNMIYHEYVRDVIEFKNTHGIYVQGSNHKSIFGTEPFITPVIAVLLDATR